MGLKYTSAVSSWTPTATADGVQLTASGYHAVDTLAATDMARILEIYAGGEATSSTVNVWAVRRHTTHASTPTNRVPAKFNPYSQASVFGSFITASTNPTVAALATIQHVINLSFNTFGGIVRWVAAPDEEIYLITATANNDEVSLSTVTGAGVASSHYVVEEM